MQKRRNIRSASKDILITALCLLGSFLFITLYLMDMNSVVKRDDSDIIATISFKRKVAQRKFIDRMVWDRLQQNAPLYNGDTIRTDTGSEAVITFNNNTVIELDESSIAQVFLSNRSGTEVNFSGGSIVASSGSSSGVTVRSGDTEVLLTSGGSAVLSTGGAAESAAISTEGESPSGAAVSLRMLSGEATVTSGGTSQAVTEGDAVSARSGELNRSAFSLLSPRPSEYILDTSGRGVDVGFSWKLTDAPADSYVLIETSVTKRFASTLSSVKVTDASNARVSFPLGTTFYRATLMSGSDEALGDAFEGAVNVIYSAPPTLTVPAQHDEFHYRSRLPVLRFGWLGNEYASSYRLEIADNEAIASPAVDVRTTESSVVVSTLGEGTWYWRVTEEFSDLIRGENAVSKVSSFTIAHRGELESVSLKMPAQGYVINSEDQSTPSVFSWEESSEAVSYDFYLSDRARGGNVIARISRVEPYVSVNLGDYGIEPGVYYWYVTQTDYEGTESRVSESRMISVLKEDGVLRSVFPPEGFTISDFLLYDTKFTWNSNLPGTVLLEIATDRNFSNVVFSKQAHGASGGLSGVNLNEGTYYWRIRSGAIQSERFISDGTAFSVVGPLPEPRIVSPSENGRVTVRPNEDSEFMWRPVEGADYYKATITSASGKEVLRDDYIEGNSFGFDFASVPNGSYVLSLHGEADETAKSSRRSGLISRLHFEIRQLRPAVLDSPGNGDVLDGVEAVVNPKNMRWTLSERPKNSELVIARSKAAIPEEFGGESSDESAIVLRTPVGGNESYKMPILRDGTFYWKVLATTFDDFNMSAMKASSFSVLPIPNLPATSGMTPEDGKTFDVNYMRNSMSARLEWQSVPDATAYVLHIDKIREDGTKERVTELTTDSSVRSYNIEDLSVLDEGKFEWSIEAQQHLSDGTLLRNGDLATSRFSIVLPKIQQFDLTNPGELYGN